VNSKTKLRAYLSAPSLHLFAGVHDALSARIAEEAGFSGLWASGLGISAQLGLRDANEASWTQVVEVVDHMTEATQVPILVDGDTGWGDFNNVRRFVSKLEARGAAGVCLEDKVFPKLNSLQSNGREALAAVGEFCARLRAAKDAQRDADFVVVARIEALVVGGPVAEALERAGAYAEAGADAVLIHSKQPTAEQVVDFMRQWGGRRPVLLVPTTYLHSTTPAALHAAGASVIIRANELLRSAIASMQRSAKALLATEPSLENRIAPLSEVFRLQRMEELNDARERYFSKAREDEP
jgi:phosphoenolpyruvate phosphomutase